ncbi:MAG: ABC transporter permease, partial [Gemmataceae bacterium]
MIRAFFWKEWRDQMAILIALVALGAGVIATATMLGSTITTDSGAIQFRNLTESGRLATLMLAMTAGTIVGGALFAGEMEAGTDTFFFSFPPPRRKLWLAKMIAGGILAFVTALLIVISAVGIGALGGFPGAFGWATAILMVSMVSYCWGALGSSISNNTLAACGIGLILALFSCGGALIATLGLYSAAQTMLGYRPDELQPMLLSQIIATLMFVIPLLWSYSNFTSVDRARRQELLTDGAVPTVKKVIKKIKRVPKPGVSRFRAMLWLMRQQAGGYFAILSFVALGFGLIGTVEEAQMMILWPSATIIFGVLAGVLSWGDETVHGASRYWGERRMPVRSLWRWKFFIGAIITFVCCLLFFLPSFIRALALGQTGLLGAFRTGLAPKTLLQFAHFTLLWPLYGYLFGHLVGLLFRKTVVSVGVGVLLSATFAAFWVPSLISGGVHTWQLLIVPCILLSATLFLLNPWVTDRLGHTRSVVVLAMCSVLVLGGTAGGLAYRFWEIPAAKYPTADTDYAATILPFEENETGREARRVTALALAVTTSPQESNTQSLRLNRGLMTYDVKPMFYDLSLITKYGYVPVNPKFDATLDAAFQNDIAVGLTAVVNKPLGPLIDPTTVTFYSLMPEVQGLECAVRLLLARGLQMQKRGKPEEYVERLRQSLLLIRVARTQPVFLIEMAAITLEREIYWSIERWLERLDDQPKLLQEVTEMLVQHERQMKRGINDAWLSHRVIARTMVSAPSLWSDKYLSEQHSEYDRSFIDRPLHENPRLQSEGSLLAFSWTVPWERERNRRLLEFGNDPINIWKSTEYRRGGPSEFEHLWFVANPRPELRLQSLSALAQAMVACRWYQAEQGRFPKTLDELRPKYLATIPLDPYAGSGQPIQMRLSLGEKYLDGETLPEPIFSYRDGVRFESAFHSLPRGKAEAVGALMGGAVRFGKPFQYPPGLGQSSKEMIGEIKFDLLAAVAGGGVQWPLPPLTAAAISDDPLGEFEGPGASGAGGPAYRPGSFSPPVPDLKLPQRFVSSRREMEPEAVTADTVRPVKVAAGQPILWCIGPDRKNENARTRVLEIPDRVTPPGDVVQIV